MKTPFFLLLNFLFFLSACTTHQLEELETAGFTANDEGINYAIVVFQNGSFGIVNDSTLANTAKYRERITNLNSTLGEDLQKLRLAALLIKETPIVTIRRFDSFSNAGDYAQRLMNYASENIPEVTAVLPISQTNYRHLIRQRDVRAYQQYYELTASVKSTGRDLQRR